MGPDDSLGTNAVLAHGLPADELSCPVLPSMDTVGPSNGRVGWAASAAPRPQEHALWPALNGPAAGCSFYFRRWIKSNLGREAVVGGTGQ